MLRLHHTGWCCENIIFITKEYAWEEVDGVVINSGVSAPEGDDLIVVFILKDKAASLNDVNISKSVTNLLIEPAIVEKWYWNKGFFSM